MQPKEREILKILYTKDFDKLEELTKTFKYDDLEFVVESTGVETHFSRKRSY